MALDDIRQRIDGLRKGIKVLYFVDGMARLAILTNLYVVESADATWLLQQTGLTWGNLASHIAKLEASGYLSVEKTFKGKKPLTTLALTPNGRDALLAYRERMLDTLAPLE